MQSRSVFTRIASWASRAVGHPAAAMIAFFTIVVWAASGPIFHYSDTWQLVINTGTTIVTFLMVFLIQSSQNRDTEALQIKLDELIFAIDKADNSLLNLEELDERELEEIRKKYCKLAEEAREARDARQAHGRRKSRR